MRQPVENKAAQVNDEAASISTLRAKLALANAEVVRLRLERASLLRRIEALVSPAAPEPGGTTRVPFEGSAT